MHFDEARKLGFVREGHAVDCIDPEEQVVDACRAEQQVEQSGRVELRFVERNSCFVAFALLLGNELLEFGDARLVLCERILDFRHVFDCRLICFRRALYFELQCVRLRIGVDVFGKCGTRQRAEGKRCRKSSNYKFEA